MMNKPVIGASRPLSAQTIGTLWQAHPFFSPDGLGRQANPAIHAAWAPRQHIAPAAPAVTRTSGRQAQAGFEEVTLLLDGDLMVHTTIPDAGNQTNTLVQTGDVLWNGAGSGIFTEKRVGPVLNRTGGILSALTLWINLPARFKASAPCLQHLRSALVPTIALDGEAGSMRPIAGRFKDCEGPIETVQPLQLWDIHVRAGSKVSLPLPAGWYAQILVLAGCLDMAFWPDPLHAPQLVLLDAAGDGVTFTAREAAHLVLLCCEPLNEPVAIHEQLVLNTSSQLAETRTRLASAD
ncbi:MAG: pirin-like C-terminal cupin domain-containing protein [Lautropia sp.]|nr:pirin-like C-terminal cupin domain-containing protein [Lautropia sp.]